MNDIKFGNVTLSGTSKIRDASDSAVSAVSPPSSPAKQQAAEQSSKNSQAETPTLDRIREAQRQAEISQAKQDQAKESSESDLEQAVTKLNDYIQTVQRDLKFNVDEDSGKMVVKVIDRKTDEVVRQIPDEVALKLARNLQQGEPLSLFNMKA